jgi:hypothetical protein
MFTACSLKTSRAFALTMILLAAGCGSEEETVEDNDATGDVVSPGDGSATADSVVDDDAPDTPGEDIEDQDTAAEELQWYLTCGDPVCREDGHRESELPPCTDEVIGDPCDTAEQLCDPIDDCNAYYICASEDPRMSEFGCPMSLREFKTSIHYLNADERAGLAERTLQIPIATWQYRQHAGSEHLGFIIEDIAPSPAIRPSGDQVDLYGYSSMILATVQEQQAQIEALRLEVASLRARLEAGDE